MAGDTSTLSESSEAANRALGSILRRTNAVAFRWLAQPGWPVALVSDNVRQWGLDPDRLLRSDPPFAELVHPEDLPRVGSEVAHHCEHGEEHFRQEYRLSNGAGGWRWVEDHTWIERDSDGKPSAFNGVLIDVTERKRAELGLEIAALTVPALLDPAGFDRVLANVLERLGLGMDADRVYVFEVHDDRVGPVTASQRFEWCQPGISAQIDNPDLQNLAFEQEFPRWLEYFRADKAIKGRVDTLPAAERTLLEAQQIRSLLVVPVSLRGRLWGFFGFDAVRNERVWTPAEERVLRLVAAALGAAIEQERSVDALRESEEHSRLALGAADAGAWEWCKESVTVLSPEAYRILGMDPALPATYEAWVAVLHPEDRDVVIAEVERSYASLSPLSIEYRVIDGDGWRWVASVGKARSGRSAAGMIGLVFDIDARKKVQQHLRLSAAVIDSTRDGVVVTDLSATIVSVNRAYCEITGYSEQELVGQNPRMLQSGRHDDSFYSAMWASLQRDGYWQGEIWSRRKGGEIYPEWLALTAVQDESGHVRHYVGVVTDTSRLKQTEAQLARLAHYDPLTELPNRLLALSRLEYAIERAERGGGHLAVLVIDMDRFKTVNDSLGHEVGDELLVAVGARLRKGVATANTVARLGGDEFLVIVEYITGARVAANIAREVLDSLRAPFRLPSGHEVFVDASIGISVFPEDGSSVNDLIRNADAALYRAKDLGRNTFHFFTPGLLDAANDRLALEGRLRHALARGEFIVHYQPLLDCDTRDLVGCEALVRWHPPGQPLIYPGRFINIAEDTGLIAPLGDWVLETAARQMQRWRRAGATHLRLAVNLSARQLRQPEFVDRITRVLADTGLDPDALELEITESTLMELGNMLIATMLDLRSIGVRFAIDDFGTGYSSLAYLRRLPIDTLKIDRSFVADIQSHQGGAEIASAIIALAHKLQLGVLAEGVESESQLSFLREQGCDEFQGFLVSQAVSADDFARLYLNLTPTHVFVG
jgi:diguanylate cyclase (GGDEF)-like protein/PAS domain S-box-containing protein